MKKIVLTAILTFGFNACTTKKVCKDCTAKIPEPQYLKENSAKKFTIKNSVGSR